MIAVFAFGLLLAGCQQAVDRPDGSVGPAGPSPIAVSSPELPFHAEMVWDKNMISPPADRCSRTLPEGVTHLWLSEITAPITATHLGAGRFEADLCIFGTLGNADAPPGQNGTPMGWYAIREVWTAANGDRLLSTGEMIGFTAPPGTPGFKFIESLQFIDGGTGRFEYAEGEGKGLVQGGIRTAVYDGWIRYGKKEK
jgi:hypothetical protein